MSEMTAANAPTPADVAAIRERVEAVIDFEYDGKFLAETEKTATATDWRYWVTVPFSVEACEFIAHAPDDIRTLLALLAASQQREAALTAALETAVAEQSRIIGERWSAHDEEVKRVLQVNNVEPEVIYDAYHNASLVMKSVMRQQNEAYWQQRQTAPHAAAPTETEGGE